MYGKTFFDQGVVDMIIYASDDIGKCLAPTFFKSDEEKVLTRSTMLDILKLALLVFFVYSVVISAVMKCGDFITLIIFLLTLLICGFSSLLLFLLLSSFSR